MRSLSPFPFNYLLVPALFAGLIQADAEESKSPENEVDKISYIIGTDIGREMKRNGVEINPEQLAAGFSDAYSGKELKLPREEMQQIMQAFTAKMREKAQSKAAELGAKNLKAGKAFLEENGKKEGVVTTESGLQYLVLKTGDGPKPKATDTVKAHYHGTLIDGTVFDSSVDRGEPSSFQLNRVIPGWTEALQLMPTGSKWKLFIPSEHAYGERGRGPVIGPNSTLIFEVELLGIE